MKRNVLNAAIWLTAGVLLILLFRVLSAESPATIPPPIRASHPQEMALMIQERQRLEKELQNLDQEKKNKTILLVSHRKSTMGIADEVIVM